MFKFAAFVLSFTLFFCSLGSVRAAELEAIGTFSFPTTTNAQAQQHFLRGVGFLHSFGLTQAHAEFREVQRLDPDFVLGYWGEVFSYQHPFFGGADARKAEALMRLAPTAELRAAKARNDKELGFLKAAEAYAIGNGSMADKRTGWMNAMLELYEKYPDDDEVKAFTAVAMLAGATAAGDMAQRINMRAGALAGELFKKNDNHPGAAHYVIHAFDDPIHAPLALEAATKYADIAPAVSHARHMPTHIFIQHGMWEQVALWNDSAFNAATELWQPGDSTGDMNHSSDWGQYGDLQLWDLDRSKLWIERAEQVYNNDPSSGRSKSTLDTLRARHIIETQQWQLDEPTPDMGTDQLLALGLSAANLGDLNLADRVVEQLAANAKQDSRDTPAQVSHAEVAALVAAKRGEQDTASTLLQEAIAVTEAGRLPNGAASPLKPVHELAGELLLQFGKPDEAMQRFEESLLRMPNRPWSLLGAARSHAALGHQQQAVTRYRELLAIWQDDSHPAVQEAKRFLGE